MTIRLVRSEEARQIWTSVCKPFDEIGALSEQFEIRKIETRSDAASNQ